MGRKYVKVRKKPFGTLVMTHEAIERNFTDLVSVRRIDEEAFPAKLVICRLVRRELRLDVYKPSKSGNCLNKNKNKKNPGPTRS